MMENEIYIVKKDVLKFLKGRVSEVCFNRIKKLIDDIEIVNGKYINVSYVYDVFDLFYDFEDIIDEFETLPTIRFLKAYDKEVVLKEDVIKAFMDLLEENQVPPGAPDYDLYMNVIKGIPIAKLED